MHAYKIVLAVALLLLVQPFAALGQKKLPQWFEDAVERRTQRLQDIDVHVKRLKWQDSIRVELPEPDDKFGLCAGRMCQVTVEETDAETGAKLPRVLSPEEAAIRAGISPNSAFIDAFGLGLIKVQNDFNQMFSIFGETGETDEELLSDLYIEEACGPGPGGSGRVCEDNLTVLLLHPNTMFGYYGRMLLETGAAVADAENSVANSADLAQADAEQGNVVFEQLAYVGEETIGDRRTGKFSNDTLVLPTMIDENQEWDVNSVSIYGDLDDYLIVKTRFEGTATVEGESRDFFIEVVNSDFRNPPGCGDMLEPYRSVRRMGGILTDAEMAEMEQARVQLADFERQLAAMPAGEREIAERMMGSQIEKMRGLVNGGGVIEHVEETEEILCNPDLAALFSVGGEYEESEESLIRRIP